MGDYVIMLGFDRLVIFLKGYYLYTKFKERYILLIYNYEVLLEALNSEAILEPQVPLRFLPSCFGIMWGIVTFPGGGV